MGLGNIAGVPAAQIGDQLSRVLASEEFHNSKRMNSFLSYLVTETLNGRSAKLKGYNIGVDVFERGDDFDPQLNPIVRVEAGRLRRLLRNYYLGPGDADPVKITIPKGAYVPLFEIPGASKDAAGSTEQRAASPVKAKQIAEDRRALAMPRGPSVAVLPFDNMSADPQHAIFSDGLAEEITTRLARFSTLFVVARHTAFQFRGKEVDVRKIGHDLEVHYVLEGSVRAAGSALRVTAQLIDATSGLHVWAENYDRKFSADNLIELQDDIAQSVTAAIAEPHGVISRYDLSLAKRRQIDDLDLYTFVLRWFEYTRRFDSARRRQLRAETTQMLKKHPNNSLVWTVRGLLSLDEEALRDGERTADSGLDQALEHLGKAIKIDPTNAKAYQYLIMTRYLLGDIEGALEAGRHAVRLNPNDSETLGEYGSFRCYSGDWGRGLDFVRKAVELNPLHSPMLHAPLCLDCYRRGDDVGALKHAENFGMSGVHWPKAFRAMIHGQLGRRADAATALAALVEQMPDYSAYAGDELRMYLKDEALVQRCLEGLAKAGLVLP